MRGEWVMSGCLAFALSLTGIEGHAEEPHAAPLVFLADPTLSMDPGIRTTRSLGRILYRYDEVLRSEDAGAEPLDAAVRGAKVVFLDGPLALAVVTLGHEVFGHGARAREQGLEASFEFRLVQPYRWLMGQDDEVAGEAFFGRQNQVDRDLALVAGGIESDYRMTYWVARDVMQQGGWAHYGDMLMYAAARLSYARSLRLQGSDDASNNDVSNYVGLLQRRFNLWTARDRESIESRLRTAYLWNFFDPVLWFAGYAMVEHVGRGERWVRAPLPEVDGVKFLPWPTFGLTPFGAEHGLFVWLERDGTLLDVYGRFDRSGLASHGGGGVGVTGIRLGRLASVGGHVDGWVQPELLFEERNAFDRPKRAGGNVAVEWDLAMTSEVSWIMSVAYKSRGFLPGRPDERGLYGFTGLSWRAP